jgi:hypothetical protein
MFDYRLSDYPDLRSSNYHEQLNVDPGLGWADTANVSCGAGTILESLNGTGIQVEQHIFLTLLMHRLLMCVTKCGHQVVGADWSSSGHVLMKHVTFRWKILRLPRMRATIRLESAELDRSSMHLCAIPDEGYRRKAKSVDAWNNWT